MCHWAVIPALVLGLFLSYQDIKSNEVNTFFSVLYVLVCATFPKAFCPWPLAVFAILGTLNYLLFKKQAFGSGDYIIIFGSSFIISSDFWPFFIALIGFFGILTTVISKKRTIPLIPSIVVSTFVNVLLEKIC